ncbi:matrixin family metalloprotease [Chitinophaga pinensis]|uniref:Peptidase M10A and M12B matrixin and adamalysin n=1 Tax=Chitinophaga pinensis (strain ATCC 43595 / DSM 2588 / LMG 13176 / NBRC 15968 / NCIMB 11800 / UQM 2034) TaxID=485918 RepID=A0A979G510_CHIPD|nr:matrixin family metalloprotease [Chitinophaga pinensis]ACU60954.1 peptidase M10A and M12B matrixin and adamalysin [Chitinophaga pinensis DSM 2588]
MRNVFELKKDHTPTKEEIQNVHLLGKGIICDTESRGHETPQNKSITELVVDASEGFIPLWEPGVTLRWRFQERALNSFAHPEEVKDTVRQLFAKALVKWGKAAPVRFTEDKDLWDFEIVVLSSNKCNASGCVLASAFFPDAGQHKFNVYPILFEQKDEEQIDTFVHETGHIFGLRHFFAKTKEAAFPSEIFGTHEKFTIMNYGSLSQLTDADKADLLRLYQQAWSRQLTNINGTPIRFVRPFSATASVTADVYPFSQIPAVAAKHTEALLNMM